MSSTKIEWADEVWNPVTGCTKVSEGCRNCYAERVASRKLPGGGFEDREFGTVRCHEDRLQQPLHWRKPRRVFVCSMGDLFHKDVPDEFIDHVFATMATAQHHTFMALTKRPERMLNTFMRFALVGVDPNHELFKAVARAHGNWPLPNVWLGVSVENQQAADERIPLLLQTPAAVRFASAEPTLGDLNLLGNGWLTQTCCRFGGTDNPECGHNGPGCMGTKIDWVICGGESGPNARPMHPDWARGLRDQCTDAGVAFLFKQWGEWIPAIQYRGTENLFEMPEYSLSRCRHTDLDVGMLAGRSAKRIHTNGGFDYFRVGKHAAGRLLDGKLWDEYPEVAR